MIDAGLNHKHNGSTTLLAFSSVFLRFALGFSFLSAGGDRFELWGTFVRHQRAKLTAGAP